MADYFTRFSLVLDLTEPAQQYALNLAAKARAHSSSDYPVPAEFPADLADLLENWVFETEQDKAGVWLHSDDGGIDAVCGFIQHLLQKFDLKVSVGFQWSDDCSKPRIDAYGGGAAYITAHQIKSIHTATWLANLNPG